MHTPTSQRTLQHYSAVAEDFRSHTLDHDVSQNIAELLAAIDSVPPFSILDFGCGPGRDLKTFRSLGHNPIGLDGCREFVEMAAAYSGVPVWQQDFLALDLPDAFFDGIFANASLFHVPSDALPRILSQLHASLKSHGILFCSNPRGDDEGWHGERYSCRFELARWREYLEPAGFMLQKHYYRPVGLPCAEQPWLAMVLRKQPIG